MSLLAPAAVPSAAPTTTPPAAGGAAVDPTGFADVFAAMAAAPQAAAPQGLTPQAATPPAPPGTSTPYQHLPGWVPMLTTPTPPGATQFGLPSDLGALIISQPGALNRLWPTPAQTAPVEADNTAELAPAAGASGLPASGAARLVVADDLISPATLPPPEVLEAEGEAPPADAAAAPQAFQPAPAGTSTPYQHLPGWVPMLTTPTPAGVTQFGLPPELGSGIFSAPPLPATTPAATPPAVSATLATLTPSSTGETAFAEIVDITVAEARQAPAAVSTDIAAEVAPPPASPAALPPPPNKQSRFDPTKAIEAGVAVTAASPAAATLAPASSPATVDASARSAVPAAPQAVEAASAASTSATPVAIQPTTPTADAPTVTATEPPASAVARATVETTASLAAEIVRKLDARSTRFDVALTPEGLGAVQVAVEIARDGALSANLNFDRPQSAAELNARAGELRQALEQAGFDLSRGGLSFSSGDGGRSSGEQSRPAAAVWNTLFADPDLLEPAPPQVRRHMALGLDVRV